MSHWCNQHPRYAAKRTPGSLCGECWRLYFLKNPEEKGRLKETYQEAERLREAMASRIESINDRLLQLERGESIGEKPLDLIPS